MQINQNQSNENYLKNYLWIWGGQNISSFGSSVVSFIIIWWITITTGSPLMLGIAGFLGVGSTVITQPIAGVLADRKRRKLILFTTDFCQAIATVWIIVLFVFNNLQIFHILTLLFLRGVFEGFQRPAINAIIPSMVPRDQLARMNSLNFLVDALINLASPAIAALLLVTVGLENFHFLMAIDTITFLIAVIPLIMVHIPEIFKKGEKPKTSFKEDFTEGFSYLKRTPGMLPLLMAYATTNFFMTPTFTLLPYMVSAPFIFNSDEKLLATVLIFFQAGALSISIILSKRNPKNNLMVGVTFGIILALTGVSIVGYSGIVKSTMLLFLGILFLGIAIPFASIYSNTIWQKFVPNELQGRVMSVRITLSGLVSPFSILFIGIASESINPAYIFFVNGILGMIIYLFALSMTKMRFIESGFDLSIQEKVNDPVGVVS